MEDIRIEQPLSVLSGNSSRIEKKGAKDFGDMIKEAINQVNRMEGEANRSVVELLQGKADVHETMIAMQKSGISMQMLLTVRNKALEAYREIIHMQF